MGLGSIRVGDGSVLNRERFIGGVGERIDLTGDIGGSVSAVGVAFSVIAEILAALTSAISQTHIFQISRLKGNAYTTSATSGTTAAAATTSTSTSGSAATGLIPALGLSSADATTLAGLRLASKLDRNLAVEDRLAVEFVDGTLRFGWSGEIDKGVADRAGGARVGRDRGRLAKRTHTHRSDRVTLDPTRSHDLETFEQARYGSISETYTR